MLDSPVREKKNGFGKTHYRALKGTFPMSYACTSFLSSWPILNAQYMWSFWTIPQSQYPSNSAHQCPHLLILLILTIADTAGFCSAKLHLSCLPKPNANSLLGSLPKSLLLTGGTFSVTLLTMCEPMYTKWRDPDLNKASLKILVDTESRTSGQVGSCNTPNHHTGQSVQFTLVQTAAGCVLF